MMDLVESIYQSKRGMQFVQSHKNLWTVFLVRILFWKTFWGQGVTWLSTPFFSVGLYWHGRLQNYDLLFTGIRFTVPGYVKYGDGGLHLNIGVYKRYL
jgi:hypothetical protein